MGKKRCAGREFHEEIYVTAIVGFVPGNGSKNADVFDPEPGCQYDDLIPFCPDPFVKIHGSFPFTS